MSAAVITNEEGRATIPRLTPGAYRLSVTGPAVWKLEQGIDVKPGAGLHTLMIRRLGDVSIRVLSADGIPVSEVELSLAFEPTGERVETWLEAGLVTAPGSLTTDNHIEITLIGLPHGVYAWRCGAAQGSMTVAPGKESRALIALQ